VVTVAGGKELEEPVVVRPTSETVIGEFMAKWVQSYRDLPLLLNQWANVVRWELRPRLFLRTSEFLWQEGHTAHATQDDARAYAVRIHHEVYESFMVDVLAMPVVVGMKTRRERFAGADNTLTLEGMMGDGKALQMATSHELGQNFARAFGIEFLDDTGAQQTAWTTSWGSSTRMVGGLIMAHGDDDGLRIPPRLAPIQVVVLAVRDEGDVVARCDALADELRAAGLRVHLDARADLSMGRRATDWELKGVPVRLEVGPRDLAAGVATMVRRITGGEDRKVAVGLDGAPSAVAAELERQQAALLDEATRLRESRTADVTTLDEARDAATTGWARIAWDAVGVDGEAELAQSGVSVRCLFRDDGTLPESDDERGLIAIAARSY
jgi:prolyl-tRNA synthetase